MLAWNASVGYSLDRTLSHPFVTHGGVKSHCRKYKESWLSVKSFTFLGKLPKTDNGLWLYLV